MQQLCYLFYFALPQVAATIFAIVLDTFCKQRNTKIVIRPSIFFAKLNQSTNKCELTISIHSLCFQIANYVIIVIYIVFCLFDWLTDPGALSHPLFGSAVAYTALLIVFIAVLKLIEAKKKS